MVSLQCDLHSEVQHLQGDLYRGITSCDVVLPKYKAIAFFVISSLNLWLQKVDAVHVRIGDQFLKI